MFGEDDPGKKQVAAGHFNENHVAFTSRDLRFTRSKDGKTLYAIGLGWPAEGSITIRSQAMLNDLVHGEIGDVRLLGTPGALTTVRDEDGLKVTLPSNRPTGIVDAYALATSLQ